MNFHVADKDYQRAKEWSGQHDQEKHTPPGKTSRYSGAIGGAYTWCFTPTNIGTVVKIKCSCGEELNLTDYDTW